MTARAVVQWWSESVLQEHATVADPTDPEHSRFELHVFATADGTATTWSVWGNRNGVHVSDVVLDVANSRDQAKRRAEAVLRAITEPLLVTVDLQRALLDLTLLATDHGLAADVHVRAAKELIRCSVLGCGLGGACDGRGTDVYPCPLRRANQEETPMNTYHPDPEINAAVAKDRAEAEAFDVAAGYPPSRWTCDCGASHARGAFPLGTTSHRCLKCGYVGPGGTLAPAPEGSP